MVYLGLLSTSSCCGAGDREAAQELAGKGKEHAQLAKDARSRANQAAYDSSNLSVVNRFKVSVVNLSVVKRFKVNWTLVAASPVVFIASMQNPLRYMFCANLYGKSTVKVCPSDINPLCVPFMQQILF